MLKTSPKHAETLSLKGASMYFSGNLSKEDKKECFHLLQQGVLNNSKSAICWHLQGLCFRSENNHAEAAKSLAMAYKANPDNLNIARDLGICQIQSHNYAGFTETRRQFYASKPTRLNTLQYVAGLQLMGQYDKAVEVIDTFLAKYIPDDTTHQTRFDDSELFFYKSQLMMEAGNNQGSYDFLKEHDARFLDRTALKIREGALLEKLQRLPEAEECYRWLIALTPENAEYHAGLRRAKSLEFSSLEVISKFPAGFEPTETAEFITEAKLEGLKSLYAELQASYPKSNTVQRTPLEFLQGAEFQAALEKYVRPKLSSGVPSLFSDIRGLYCDDAKRALVESSVTSFMNNLKSSGKFSPEDETVARDGSLLWTYFFLASHYDFFGDSAKALEMVDLALELAQAEADKLTQKNLEEKEKAEADAKIAPEETENKENPQEVEQKATPLPSPPSLTDSLMLKAFILKHAGDSLSAHQMMNKSRCSDLFDRFLNTKCTKMAFQAGRDKMAHSTVFLFLRDGDSLNSLCSNQAVWYELQEALCNKDLKNYAIAHKKFTSVENIYRDYWDSFSDFHGYQARKGTMRTYYQMIKFQNKLKAHKFHVRAACSHVEMLLEYAKVQKARTQASITRACADAKLDAAKIDSFTAEEKKAYSSSLAFIAANDAVARTQSQQTAETIYDNYIKALDAENECNAPAPKAAADDASAKPSEDPLGYSALESVNVEEEVKALMVPLLKLNGNSISTLITGIQAHLAFGEVAKARELVKKAQNSQPKYVASAMTTTFALPAVHFHPSSFALHGIPVGVKRVLAPIFQSAEIHFLQHLTELVADSSDDSKSKVREANDVYVENSCVANKGAEKLINTIAASRLYVALGDVEKAISLLTTCMQNLDNAHDAALRAPLRAALLFLQQAASEAEVTETKTKFTDCADTIKQFAHGIFPMDTAFLSASQLKALDEATQITKPIYAAEAANPPKPMTEEEKAKEKEEELAKKALQEKKALELKKAALTEKKDALPKGKKRR